MLGSLGELYVARLREFYRQPARIFWVYGFPTVLAIGLGLAFRNPGKPTVEVDVTLTEDYGPVEKLFQLPGGSYQMFPQSMGWQRRKFVLPAEGDRPRIEIRFSEEEGKTRLEKGETALLVTTDLPNRVKYRFDPTRPESASARTVFDDVLQRANGRTDPVVVEEDIIREAGSRYIDFLIPGLIGQNTMGGGSGASGS